MSAPSTRVMLYASDPGKTCTFYERHFGFVSSAEDQGVIELHHPRGGLILLVHRAALSLKGNQARVKLVFDVENLEAFRSRALSNGLEFGPIHLGEGHGFANSKDPDGNGVSISSRAFRSR